MSQSSFPEDVCKWSPEHCRQNLHVLPRIMGDIENAESSEKQIEGIQILCQSFVPVIDIDAVERLVLCEIMQKVRQCYKSNIDAISSVIESTEETMVNLQFQLQTHLQNCVQVISSLNNIVEHLCQTEEELLLCHYPSLPPAVLEVIQTSYSHCKESASIYGDILSAVSDHLSDLFRKAHSLQVVFLNLIDKTSVPTNVSESEVEVLCHIIYCVFEISEVASSLDKKIMLSLWKAVSRWCCQHRILLVNRLDIVSMLSSLANDMTDSLRYLFVQDGDDEKSFIRKVKAVGFQMKVLVKLVKEYDGYLGNCIHSIVELILQVLSNVPPSVRSENVPTGYFTEFQQQVVTAVEPLIHCLVQNHEFVVEITRVDSYETSCDTVLTRLLLTLQILDVIPHLPDDVQHIWIKPNLNPEDVPRISIIKSLFRDFSNANSAFMLPVREPFLLQSIMHGGKPQRMVTVYEHTCTRFCAFVACLAHNLFSVLEKVLLENILGRNLHSAALAIDTMSFVARYGTADLCKDHSFMIGDLLMSSQISASIEYTHLVVLFRRLFNFLAPEHRSAFVERYPAKDNVSLWSVVPMSSFTGSTADQIVETLVSHCTQHLCEWLDKSCYTAVDVQSLKIVVTCLINIYECDSVVETHVSEAQRIQVLTKIMDLWAFMPLQVVIKYDILQTVMSLVIQLTTSVVKWLDNSQIYDVITTIWNLLKLEPKSDIKLATLDLLSTLGTKLLEPSVEQVQTLSTIPVIFRALLQDKCCVVHQEALQTFAQFAQETSHECIVPESLNNSKIHEVVVNYFNQVANCISFEPTVEEISAQADVMKRFHEAATIVLYTEAKWPNDSIVSEIESNNSRTDCKYDWRINLDQLKKTVAEVEVERQKRELPEWVRAELQLVHNRLSTLLT